MSRSLHGAKMGVDSAACDALFLVVFTTRVVHYFEKYFRDIFVEFRTIAYFSCCYRISIGKMNICQENLIFRFDIVYWFCVTSSHASNVFSVFDVPSV